MSNLNKGLMFFAFIILMCAFAITGRGQSQPIGPVPDSIPFGVQAAPTGFTISGILQHGGFTNGKTIWNIGAGTIASHLGIVATDPSLANRLKELEGMKVRMTIEVAK